MRIVNEKYLDLVWSWDEYEKKSLQTRYQANLERLVAAIRRRVQGGTAPPPEDLRALAAELQEAGEALQQSVLNCYDAARNVYLMAAATPEEREVRCQQFEDLAAHIGKGVRLTQTSAPELEDKTLILEEIQGIKGVLRDGDSLWEAMIDFLVPDQEKPDAETGKAALPPAGRGSVNRPAAE
jgi:hypothetical protein